MRYHPCILKIDQKFETGAGGNEKQPKMTSKALEHQTKSTTETPNNIVHLDSRNFLLFVLASQGLELG